MGSPENESAIKKYFKAKLVVVEVQNGETQEQAWGRHLAANPEVAGAHVKIFHYPEPSSLKGKREISLPLRQVSRGENLP